MAHHMTADGGYSTDVRLRALLAVVVGAPDPFVASTTYCYPAVPVGDRPGASSGSGPAVVGRL